MQNDNIQPLRRILHRALTRFMAVTLRGLLLADVNETAGRAIEAELQSDRTDVFFLHLDVSREPQHVFRGYQQGGVDYLVKPFAPEVLFSKVAIFVDLYLERQKVKRQALQLASLEKEALERQSEYRYRWLTDSMPTCVFAAQRDGLVRFANRVFLDYSGLALDDSLDDGYLQAVHPEDQAPLREAWGRLARDLVPLELPFRLRRKDGEHRWHLARGLPERSEDGVLSGFVLTATDIDDQKRTERELGLANTAKDLFIAAASHELRTPLSAAKGYMHLALNKFGPSLNPEVTRVLSRVDRQLDALTKLVNDLLDVSRLTAGRLSLELGDFLLIELLSEVMERVQVLSDAHPLQLECPPGLTVEWDRGRMDQVVTNLISNAIRYSPRGGPVHLRVTEMEERVQLAVRDQGLGIPLDRQAAIFERFGRAHGARYGGIGLGLTISQGIVEQHGGLIRVSSSGVEGEGSTFTVEVPRRGQVTASG